MKKLLPSPLLSVALFVFWLLLNRSLSLDQLLLALLLALLIPVMTAGLRPVRVCIKKPFTVLRLLGCVAVDSLLSSLSVLVLLIKPSQRKHPSGFIYVHLEMRDPNALAMLALIVCLTPGTAWIELSLDSSTLLLHAMEVSDGTSLAAAIKTRYEVPLMEIFQS
jgi:multicomponent K+:H+ antiporter subunit E